MRRLVLLALVLAALAIVGWFFFARTTASRSAALLLPRETIFFAHAPDFTRMQDQWHQSDIYQLYREPAVQDFLRKPLANAPKADAARQTLNDIKQLDPKDAFVALTSIEDSTPRLIAGFRFRGRQTSVEQIVDKWRTNLLRGNGNAARQKVMHRRHEIEVVSAGRVTFATTYAQNWFFASNDVAELKALLDRADALRKNRQSALESDDEYRRAVGHMPSEYALLVYLQPKTLAEKLSALRVAFGRQIPGNEPTLIEQIRSVCGMIRFEHGKMHDVLFAAIPRRRDARLTRSAEALGSTDTFLYVAMLLNLDNLGAVSQAPASLPIGSWLQKFVAATQKNGITVEDWKTAFELELSALADWLPNARWPSIIATLPVKDAPRAQKIVAAMTTAIDEDAVWTKTEKDGVTYFTIESPGTLFAIHPTIGLSDRLFIAGLEPSAVEAAMGHTQHSTSSLSRLPTYEAAARRVPTPTDSFAYVDLALLYSRLDAAVRPLLMLGAAFLPAIANDVDVGKLPPPDTITKHLSPIVSSLRYERDGYIAESVGPITANQAALLIGLAAVYRAATGHRSD
jgi:hypothetical protein